MFFIAVIIVAIILWCILFLEITFSLVDGTEAFIQFILTPLIALVIVFVVINYLLPIL